MKNRKAELTSNRRIMLSMGVILFLMLVLVVRIFYLMYIKADYYQKQAYSQQIYTKKLEASRGDIYDVNGNELAVAMKVSNIFIDPIIIREQYKDPMNSKLMELFNYCIDELGVEKKSIEAALELESNYYVIKKELSNNEKEKLKSIVVDNNLYGIHFEDSEKRAHPASDLASHIIGFTNYQNNGVLGIEQVYNRILTGVDGSIITEVDRENRQIPFSEAQIINEKDGANIYLTIDRTIQNMTENALKKAIEKYNVINGGTIIVMDPNNGDVLSLATYPTFDLDYPSRENTYIQSNKFSKEDDLTLSQEIERYVWRNKAISDTYEPGSTFKAITLAAAIEEGNTYLGEFYDATPVKIDGWTINHWMDNPPATETVEEAMYFSSNPVFVRLSQEMGLFKFYEYMDRFGFFEITGINLPSEASAIVKSNPLQLDMAVNAFGQRFQVTPIQIINAYCAIANGGNLLKPHVVDRIVSKEGKNLYESERLNVRKVISEKTSETMKYILENTVNKGTGINAYVKGYRVAGKTGTSETLETESKNRYIASFAGFAPANAPEIAILVVFDYPDIENHGGGEVAAPVAGDLIEDILVYLRVEREYTNRDYEMMADEYIVDDLTLFTGREAKNMLGEKGVTVKIVGDEDDIVISQVPSRNEVISKNPYIILYTNNEKNDKVDVPDLVGMTMNEAIDELSSVNLNGYYDVDFGVVVSQSIEPRTKVDIGTIIEIDMKELTFTYGD